MDTIAALVRRLNDQNVEMIPLPPSVILHVSNISEIQMPKTYLDFLSQMGGGAGRFMRGSSVFIDELFDLQEGGVELLQENNFKSLPENAFVFWMHQGYQLAFFILGESDNPNVYFFSEGNEQDDFLKKGTLFDFLKEELEHVGY